jgi:hypothetical protein
MKAATLRVTRALQRVSTGAAPGPTSVDVDALVGTTRKTTKSRLEFVEPKSRTSRRAVRLPDFAVKTLKEHPVAQKIHRIPAGAALDDSKVRKESLEKPSFHGCDYMTCDTPARRC